MPETVTLHSTLQTLFSKLYTLDSLVLLVKLLRGPDEAILPKLIVEVGLAPRPFASFVVLLHADLISGRGEPSCGNDPTFLNVVVLTRVEVEREMVGMDESDGWMNGGSYVQRYGWMNGGSYVQRYGWMNGGSYVQRYGWMNGGSYVQRYGWIDR